MSTKKKIRLPYIDNIRSLCIYSLFIWHTCEVFHCKEGFYIEGTKDFLCTYIYCFVSPWIMAVMFFIAGISSMLSLENRSLEQFYKDRVKRILKPTIAGIILWVPLGTYFVMKNHFSYEGNLLSGMMYFFTHCNEDMYGYDGSFTPAQLWFVCFLCAYLFLAYPVIKYVLDKKEVLAEKRIVSWKTILLLVVVNFVLCYGSTEETFLAFGMFFVLGLILHNNKSFYEFIEENWKVLLFFALTANLMASYALILIRDLEVWTWQYAVCRMIWSAGRVLAVFAVLGAGKVWLNIKGSVWKYLSSNSFSYYFIHMQILIAVAYYVITYVNAMVGIQWLLIISISVVLTIVTVEVFKRLFITRWLFELR